ncbi:MAG: NAD(P)-dependent oxidoreductase [Chitinophagaceae bacterium]|nr:NAD(P)-dependent oxidoreductase [Chitinophagaceae bacterium]
MKILVTGANGLLGQELVGLLLQKKYEVIATSKGPNRLELPSINNFAYRELDITDGLASQAVLNEYRPAVIIHAAAMTQVDECELNKIDCYNINVTATRFLIEAAKDIHAKFIYVSTDFIFDGLTGPYTEDDEPKPLNYYGSTKLSAETEVMESGLNWSIVRTVLVIGNASGTRSNIITWVREKLTKGEKIKVVDDQFRTPTFTEDLAKGILLVVEKDATGIFHVSGKDLLTPYQIALKTADHFKLDHSLIEKADVTSFSQPAVRPPRTGFYIEKARKELGYEPLSFEEGLQKFFPR